ncbi:CRISPR-associated protein [Nocardiopsis sediminis]|uniref:CRISPR-associated protein n=1 Tax=Nocardiopsis sediminis TaxID=1778267 RepID=A0ABV8FEC0_9ACTN
MGPTPDRPADPGAERAPDTLVALAGTSPTPALLSALTFAPRRLVVVHGGDTAQRAAAIAGTARRLCPGIEDARLVDLGRDTYDFAAVRAGFDRMAAGLTGDWRLCYTGGTKVMSVHAVLQHARRFPGRHRWRSYLDATSESLRFTDGSLHPGGIDSSALTIDALAGLHGIELRPGDRLPEQQAWLRGRPVPLGPGDMAEARVLDLFRRRLADTPGAEVMGNRVMPDPRSPRESIGDFDLIVRYRHRVLCVEVKKDPSHILDAAGWTLTKAQRAFGGAARVLFVHTGDKGDCSIEQLATYDPELSGAPLHVRALSELERDFPTADHVVQGFFPAAAPAGNGGTGAVAPVPDGTAPATHPGPSAGPVLLLGLGGSRLSVLAAARACLPARTVMLFTRQSEKEISALDLAVRRTLFAAEAPDEFRATNRRRLASRLRHDGYPERVKFADTAVDGADAAEVAAYARAKIDQYRSEPAPVIADITTGTKAMSIGLAMAAHERGGCVTFVSPLTRRVSCHAHGDVGRHGPAAVDWRIVLRGYRVLHGPLGAEIAPEIAARQIDTELIDAAADAIGAAAGGHEVAAWVDRTVTADAPPLPQYSAPQRPTVILTVADRALGLSAPRRQRLRHFTTDGVHREQDVGAGGWAHDVFAAARILNVRCGTAGLTLALHRPGDGDPARALDLIDWFAWWHTGRPGAGDTGAPEEAITGHEDTRRPRVVSAEPGTPAFHGALAAHVTALRL